jgi:hypothetical protein
LDSGGCVYRTVTSARYEFVMNDLTFELMRTGWPNTVAILALALLPIVALSIQ